MSWEIAEWYGQDLRSMTPQERHDAALLALATKEKGMSEVEQPICPFLATVRPDARCNKVGGVCSIRDYGPNKKSRIPDLQPAAVCPNRFLEVYGDESIFAYIAREFFGVNSGAKVIKEVPFLNTTDAQGVQRSAKLDALTGWWYPGRQQPATTAGWIGLRWKPKPSTSAAPTSGMTSAPTSTHPTNFTTPPATAGPTTGPRGQSAWHLSSAPSPRSCAPGAAKS